MNIIMPKMGESVNEGTIIKWYKSAGDVVKRDEIIFEISTDKVDTEIPSPASGKIAEIKIKEGETVDVDTVVAILEADGEGVVEKKEDIAAVIDKVEQSENILSEVPKVVSSGKNIVEIEMPKMGESVMEGTIIKWFKKVGDAVKRDETLFEISTDKVDTEVPSSVEGVIAEILVGEQETVDVGTAVAKISTDIDFVVQKSTKFTDTDNIVVTPQSMHDNFSTPKNVRDEKPDTNRFYSPLVLSIALKESVGFDELAKINGSGINNRVTKKDILHYVKLRTSGKMAETPTETSQMKSSSTDQQIPVFHETGDIERIPMDNIRQKIMEHMVVSRDTSVHVTELVEVDMSGIVKFINDKKDEYLNRDGIKLTYLAFVADACTKALKKYPLVNSSIDGNTIIQKKFINLGIAVALEPAGLIVPNIKSADQRNIPGLASAINDLATRARNKKLTPDDISGGTFTITNFGVFGTVFGTPIINQPEVAILGVGAVIKKPVVIEVDGSDSIAIRPIMAITLSHDHRLVDGMLGSLFIKFIKETLEGFDPASF
jgi:2-oxoglutarate dehydrogenase E2 component (dihydrolipoamide succinyltransferase)